MHVDFAPGATSNTAPNHDPFDLIEAQARHAAIVSRVVRADTCSAIAAALFSLPPFLRSIAIPVALKL